MQLAIPCLFMRGGTSKGPYFLASDLPSDPEARDRVLLRVMGSPDGRQIDGLGGADPLTSKVAVVSASSRKDSDIDFLFAQVKIDEPEVDVSLNCGNMLAGVGPFAIERGLVTPGETETTVRIFMVNSGNRAEAVIRTPGGMPDYEGDARIDGVPGTSAPIAIRFLDTEGSACGSLLPTGRIANEIDGVQVTCIDNGMPVVIVRARDLGRTGYEPADELNDDSDLKARLESLRLKAGPMMNLGDVARRVMPKMCLVAAPQDGGAISTRSFIPHVCHSSIGVLAAVTVATSCTLPGSTSHSVARLPEGNPKSVSVEHPTGEFTIELELDDDRAEPKVKRSALLRTARPIMDGNALIPKSLLS